MCFRIKSLLNFRTFANGGRLVYVSFEKVFSILFIRFDQHIATTAVHQQPNLWHAKVGHPSSSWMKLVHEIDFSVSFSSDFLYTAICKATSSAFSHKPLSFIKNIWFDTLWGPFAINWMDGHRIFSQFLMTYTKCTWVHLMQSKAEVRSLLKHFLPLLQINFRPFKVIRNDKGPKFHCKLLCF